jgi:hypothetical protein
MPQNIFRPRDLEILRTLCRLRHVTGRELRTAFFGSDDPGRKRLKVLSGRMVIAPHSKGLPPATNYRTWRLTGRGLDLVSRTWPWEPVPDGLVDRAKKASLYNLYHREAINAVYLDYLRGSATQNSAADPEAMTERANSLLWYPDGDCVLRYERQGRPVELVPDGVATSRHRHARVFIEVDRSSKTLARIRENLERYADYLRLRYATDFSDKRVPHVLYVARSASRRSHLTSLFKQIFAGRFEWQVLLFGKTTPWLEATLRGDKAGEGATEASASELPPKTTVHDIAEEALRWTNDLLSRMKRRGMLESLDREDPTFFDEGQRTLLHLYRELGMGDAS